MNYFDSDMSKSTNTVVYFDWKAVIYIYVCGQMLHTIYATKFESVTCTGACANEIMYPIYESLVLLQSERGTSCQNIYYIYSENVCYADMEYQTGLLWRYDD